MCKVTRNPPFGFTETVVISHPPAIRFRGAIQFRQSLPAAPSSARNQQQSPWRPSKPRSHAFAVLISARFLVLKIHGELNYAGAEILDRLTIPGKWNGACAEERIDCGSARMVEEVEDLC